MTQHNRTQRQGAVLLEALVALMIVSVAGVAAIAAASTHTHTVATAQARERELRAASAFLDDVALWTRDDLDRHLGDRREGDWHMRIDHDSRDLYDVTISDSAGGMELLRTTFYRRASFNTAGNDVQ